jgi:hypothetical protein
VIGRKNVLALSVLSAALVLGALFAGTIGVAQAVIITEEQHWKYRIDRWLWDEDRRRTYGIITPQIVIQNETADRLEGFVADANGTRLDMYDGEQVVNVKFMSNSSITSDWILSGRVTDGFFAIDIPQQYREAEIVRILIGNNRYTVSNGTPTTAPTEVNINSAQLYYRTNSTLQVETQVASVAEPVPVSSVYAGGSLIDWILGRNAMLPVGSPDPGK